MKSDISMWTCIKYSRLCTEWESLLDFTLFLRFYDYWSYNWRTCCLLWFPSLSCLSPSFVFPPIPTFSLHSSNLFPFPSPEVNWILLFFFLCKFQFSHWKVKKYSQIQIRADWSGKREKYRIKYVWRRL